MTTDNTLIPQDRSRDELWRAAHEGGAVAPHEGRELELLRAGTKAFAVIEKGKDAEQYRAAWAIRREGFHVYYREGDEGPEVVVAKDHRDVQQYLDLLAYGVQRLGIKQYHREMGRLFGYAEADIEAFISAEIHCDCSKCRGS